MAETQYKNTAEILEFAQRGIPVERIAQSKVEHEQFCAEEPQIDPNNSEWYKSICEALTVLQQQSQNA